MSHVRQHAESEHELFEAVSGTLLTPLWIDDRIYGYRVRQAGDNYIDVLRMIFNWRIAVTPVNDPMWISRAWCYQGTRPGGVPPGCARRAGLGRL